MDFSKILNWLGNRAKEKSTWGSIVTVGALFGLDVFSNPEFVEAFGATGVLLTQLVASVLALVGIAKKNKDAPDIKE